MIAYGYAHTLLVFKSARLSLALTKFFFLTFQFPKTYITQMKGIQMCCFAIRVYGDARN